MRTDDRGTHFADCMFCGQEWIVSRYVKEPYTCPKCRAMYKNLKPTTVRRKQNVKNRNRALRKAHKN